MTDQREDAPLPEEGEDAGRPSDHEADARSDIEQAVAARTDALKRGESGPEPETFTDPGMPDGVGGSGGVVKNQDDDAQ